MSALPHHFGPLSENGHAPTEEGLHRAVVELLAVLEAQGRLAYFHPANGEKRSKATAGRLKAMGVRAGVPDLILFVPSGTRAIELKAPKKYPSPEQRAWHATLARFGVETAICRSVDDVLSALSRWGVTNARAA